MHKPFLAFVAAITAALPIFAQVPNPATNPNPSTGTGVGGVGEVPAPAVEVRGTWVTTTGNTAIATPEDSARTMQRLKEIGLNAVYVETWKNGYTQYPSAVLNRVIGVDRRPALVKQDPSDDPAKLKSQGRDLLAETLIEAHRQGLVYIGWFEYGFMAAHKDTDNHLRRMKPEWLSKDIKGNTVAPNGFVWMNPLHPETRRFLLDLILEAVDKYDLDGVQLDDRIVWPYITMGYDDYTKKIYAQEHDGKEPPADAKDEGWRRWRADKINEYAMQFVKELRAKRPGLIVSLSPAVYPWCYENYCLEWPKWSAWAPGNSDNMWWDEFLPQVYRFNYKAFEQTWLEQVKYINEMGAGRVKDMYAGIRLVGEGADSTWEDLRDSMDLVRKTGGGGHIHWFSRGVLDVFPTQLTQYYDVAHKGPAAHPRFGSDWRPGSIPLKLKSQDAQGKTWSLAGASPGKTYQVIVRGMGQPWRYHSAPIQIASASPPEAQTFTSAADADEVELLIDRREDMKTFPPHPPRR